MDIIYEIKSFDGGIVNLIYSYLGTHPLAWIIEDNIIETYFDKLYQDYLDTYAAFMFGAP